MAQDSDLEKTEPASPRRLEKAREEGQVVRSRELATFLALLCGVGGLWVMGPYFYTTLLAVVRRGLHFDAGLLQGPADWLISARLSAWQALLVLLPMFAALVVAALLASLLLGGGVWSLQAMAPKFGRLNPVQGFKRMLGAQTWVELGKTLSKAALVAMVGFQVIFLHYDDMLALSAMAPTQALIRAMALVAVCCAWIAASLLLVVMIDVPWQLWNHARQLRMSREDVRQEHKESEGDPQLKGRIRQRQRAMAFNRMMSAVPKADVIVTNPTHYAVALQYREQDGGAPRVIAKGAGLLAQRIRALGDEHAVPQLQAPSLARAIYYSVALEHEIPTALYQAVAQVLAWVYQVRRWRAGDGAAPVRPDNISVPAGLDPKMEHTRD